MFRNASLGPVLSFWKKRLDHKQKMKELNASLAGEMSGHTFFNDKWYGFDDGLYAAARLLEILSEFDDPSKILKALPKGFSTPELNIKLNEGEQHKIIAELQETASFPGATEIIKIDSNKKSTEITFQKNASIDPIKLIDLIQSDHRFKMNGPDKLKVALEEEEVAKRVTFITKKIDDLKV